MYATILLVKRPKSGQLIFSRSVSAFGRSYPNSPDSGLVVQSNKIVPQRLPMLKRTNMELMPGTQCMQWCCWWRDRKSEDWIFTLLVSGVGRSYRNNFDITERQLSLTSIGALGHEKTRGLCKTWSVDLRGKFLFRSINPQSFTVRRCSVTEKEGWSRDCGPWHCPCFISVQSKKERAMGKIILVLCLLSRGWSPQ